MGSKSEWLEKQTLDHTYGRTTFTPAATLYLAAFVVAPTGAGGGTEASGGGYSRLAVPNDGTSFPAATGGSPSAKTTGAAFSWPAAVGAWSGGSALVAWAWFDAPTGGHMYHYGDLLAQKPVLEGDIAVFPIGDIDVTED